MKLKRTTAEAAKYFRSHNCELLDEYTGVMNKMSYRCRCGRISQASYNQFSSGKRCGYCGKNGRNKKYSQEEVKEIFSNSGGELLSNYSGFSKTVEYRCKCGKVTQKTFNAFLVCNHCRECIDRSGEKNPSWVADREKLKIKQIFRKKCYKALHSSLKATNKIKIGKTTEMLGYGPEELQMHIINHPNWPKVKNKKWHLDHIFPIQAFIEHNITDIKIINSLDNLQPITQRKNNQKKDKYNKDNFIEWLRHKI